MIIKYNDVLGILSTYSFLIILGLEALAFV